MHAGTIYARIKRVIAGIKNMPAAEIFARSELGQPPLQFDGQARRALSGSLNAEFGTTLTPDETGAAKTVRDLFKLVDASPNAR